MQKRRIFISIDIPEELKTILEGYIQPFFKSESARVVRRDQWHITLVFCGDIDEEKLDKLKDRLQNVTAETDSFELVPDKIIFAPPFTGRPPRMVWLTFKESPDFLNLSARLADFAQEPRKINCHLTLVRLRDGGYLSVQNMLPKTGLTLQNDAKPFFVKKINIIESQLSSLGPEYEIVGEYNLKI